MVGQKFPSYRHHQYPTPFAYQLAVDQTQFLCNDRLCVTNKRIHDVDAAQLSKHLLPSNSGLSACHIIINLDQLAKAPMYKSTSFNDDSPHFKPLAYVCTQQNDNPNTIIKGTSLYNIYTTSYIRASGAGGCDCIYLSIRFHHAANSVPALGSLRTIESKSSGRCTTNKRK